MLGKLIQQYRHDNGLSGPQMAEKMTEAGWKMGFTRLSQVERRSNPDSNWSKDDVRAVAEATGYSYNTVAFWAGRHSVDLGGVPADLTITEIEIGMAMLKGFVGGTIDLEGLPINKKDVAKQARVALKRLSDLNV